jgi:hypothetical protein
MQDEKNQSKYMQLKNRILAFIALILVLSLGMFLITWIQSDSNSSKDSGKKAAELTELDSLTISQDGKDLDPETQLVLGTGFEIVKGNCTNCHSSALIIQNRFTREGWKAKIEWMQETQGLWPLGESEDVILDYLAEHYAPEAYVGRRAPLENIEWYELD